jgi:nucleoside-specific outer membrane channel protein Tsx
MVHGTSNKQVIYDWGYRYRYKQKLRNYCHRVAIKTMNRGQFNFDYKVKDTNGKNGTRYTRSKEVKKRFPNRRAAILIPKNGQLYL